MNVTRESTARGADYNRSASDAQRENTSFAQEKIGVDMARFLGRCRREQPAILLCITHVARKNGARTHSRTPSCEVNSPRFTKSTGYENARARNDARCIFCAPIDRCQIGVMCGASRRAPGSRETRRLIPHVALI